MTSLVTHVGQGEDVVTPKLVLHIEVELAYGRVLLVVGNGPHLACRAVQTRGKRIVVGKVEARGPERGGWVAFSSDYVGVVTVSGLVVDAESAANRGLARTCGIKGKSEARTDVPVVNGLATVGDSSMAALDQTVTEVREVVNLSGGRVFVQISVGAEYGCRRRVVEGGDESRVDRGIRNVMGWNQQVVAHSEVQRQPAVDLPVVLEIGLKVGAAPVSHTVTTRQHAVGIERPFRVGVDFAQKHVGQAVSGGIEIAGVVAGEIVNPLSFGSELFPQLELLEEESELERVAIVGPRYVIPIGKDRLGVVGAHVVSLVNVETKRIPTTDPHGREQFVSGVGREENAGAPIGGLEVGVRNAPRTSRGTDRVGRVRITEDRLVQEVGFEVVVEVKHRLPGGDGISG